MEPLGREDVQGPPCKQGLKGGGFSGEQEEWEHWPKKHLPGEVKAGSPWGRGEGDGPAPMDKSVVPAGPQEVAATWVSEGSAATQTRGAQPSPPLGPCSFGFLLPPGCLPEGRQ